MAHQRKPKQAKLLKELETTPIVTVACSRAHLPRSTFYRWMQEDDDFAGAVQEATSLGTSLVNDMAESQVIQGIKDGKQGMVMFWLRHNHEKYGPRSAKEVRRKGLLDRQPMKAVVEFMSPPHQCVKCGGPCDQPSHQQ